MLRTYQRLQFAATLCKRTCSMAAAAAMSTAAAAASTAVQPKVAVIGGGVAGLSAAQALVRHNVHVTVLDMGGRTGGRVASRRFEQPDLGQLSFDHGAQFFTAISPEFKQQVAAWQAAGVVAQWQGRHGLIGADGSFEERASLDSSAAAAAAAPPGFCGALTGLPLYVGLPTNNSLLEHMAQELLQQPAVETQQQSSAAGMATVLSGRKVQSMGRVGGGCGCGSVGSQWQLRGSRQGRAAAAAAAPGAGQAAVAAAEQEEFGAFDAVVLADAMPLLPGSAGHIEGIEAQSTSLSQLARSVQSVAPQPCFALMVAFREPLPGVPFDSASIAAGSDGSTSSTSSSFQWVACNSSKPGRPQGGSGSGSSGGAPQCWVALTSPQRTEQLLAQHPLTVGGRFNPQTQQYQAAVAAELLADFRALMAPFCEGPVPEPAYCHSQRWGRAFVPEPLGTEFLFLPAQRLALCGDIAAGSSVEAAWRSGRAAGNAVASMLRSAA